MLFASDDDLHQLQREASRLPRGVELAELEKRREAMENARELREHQRWREFAWLLFIAPIWGALLVLLIQWVVARFLLKTSS